MGQKKVLIAAIEGRAGRRSSGGTGIVPPAEFLPASVIQYGRALHDSVALRKARSNKTQQFQIAASLPPPKPLNVIPGSTCVRWGAVSFKGTATGAARSGNSLSWR